VLALLAGAAIAAPAYDPIWEKAKSGIDGGAAVIRPDGEWHRSDYADDRRIPVASVSKLMTAQVVLQLVAEQKLQLSTVAREVLPWLPTWTQAITVEQLLTHSSGLANMDDCLGKDAEGLALINLTRAKALRSVKERTVVCVGSKPAHQPGERFDYNNLDFLVLHALVEAVDKKSFEKVLHTRVFSPAGMRGSSLAPWGDLPKDVLRSYQIVEGKKLPEIRFNQGVYGGAGSVVSTFGDIRRWVTWTMKQPDAVSGLGGGSRFGGFQGLGAYAFSRALFAAEPVSVIERPGATGYYQWQVTILPQQGIAAISFAVNDGAQLGSVFQNGGLTFELLREAATH
jgi:CubicO group peptidase (beta-lactamase class C family)